MDVTEDTHLAIDYSSNTDIDLKVALSNVDANGDTERANLASLVMPTGTDKRLLIPLAAINEDVIDFSTFPDNFPFPDVDLTSLDIVGLEFRTATLGAEFSLTQVAFLRIPEPTFGGLVLSGILLPLVLRRRSIS